MNNRWQNATEPRLWRIYAIASADAHRRSRAGSIARALQPLACGYSESVVCILAPFVLA
jgi:hypothetical protein